MAQRLNRKSTTWIRVRDRMIVALDKAEKPSVKTLKRFSKYSLETKAAVVANYTRGAYHV